MTVQSNNSCQSNIVTKNANVFLEQVIKKILSRSKFCSEMPDPDWTSIFEKDVEKLVRVGKGTAEII